MGVLVHMRGRLTITLIVTMLVILVASILITFNTVLETQASLEKTLFSKILPRLETKSEILKEVEVYRAFYKKQAIEITRRSLYLYSVVIIVMTLLFLFFSFQVTKPIVELKSIMQDFREESAWQVRRMQEKGSLEVRSLIRSFNEMIKNLEEYRSIVGDRGRFLGWREISRFIVHELNNLTSPIETYAGYMLETHSNSKDDRETMTSIISKINDMKQILSRLGDISHLPEPAPVFIDLKSFLKDIIEEFSNVDFSTTQVDIQILADPLLFSEIVRNIIKNARESGDNVKVSIRLKLRKGNLEILISDNGPGIKQSITKKIFEPGFSTKNGNLGVGLSIVKILSEAMGFSIFVESVIGKGSTFIIMIPEGKYKREYSGS